MKIHAVCMLAMSAMSVCATSPAAVRLGYPFSDGMVLQRDMPVRVWGTAAPAEKVVVSFAGQTAEGMADADGRWRVELAPVPASKEGRALTANDARIDDVLVGEVWLCCGQSNMELPLWRSDWPRFRDRQGALVAQMTHVPHLRFANGSRSKWSVSPQRGAEGESLKWYRAEPENLVKPELWISAIGFYYGLDLVHALDVPVGIIVSCRGATGIDAWIPREGLATRPDLKDVLEFPVTDKWTKDMAKEPFRSANNQPCVIFNANIAPIAPCALRGMIWYQGEHHVVKGEPERYCSKMHALYNGYARAFENPLFRLYFAQIAPWSGYLGFIPAVQEAQQKFAEEEPNAAIAITCDLGNVYDIHPNEKAYVAKRLVVHALKRDYGFADMEDESPSVEAATAEKDGTVILAFRHARELYVYFKDPKNPDGEWNMEIAGEDGTFHPAFILNVEKKRGFTNGSVRGRTLHVRAEGVPAPKRIRYLHNGPSNGHGNIYNEVGLPLGPFQNDVRPPLETAEQTDPDLVRDADP